MDKSTDPTVSQTWASGSASLDFIPPLLMMIVVIIEGEPLWNCGRKGAWHIIHYVFISLPFPGLSPDIPTLSEFGVTEVL